MADKEIREWLSTLNNIGESFKSSRETLKDVGDLKAKQRTKQNIRDMLLKRGASEEEANFASDSNDPKMAEYLGQAAAKRLFPDPNKAARNRDDLKALHGSNLSDTQLDILSKAKTREEQDKDIEAIKGFKGQNEKSSQFDTAERDRQVNQILKPEMKALQDKEDAFTKEKGEANNVLQLLKQGKQPNDVIGLRFLARTTGKEGTRITDAEMQRYLQNNLHMTAQKAANFITSGDWSTISPEQRATIQKDIQTSMGNSELTHQQIIANHLHGFSRAYSQQIQENPYFKSAIKNKAEDSGLEFDPEKGEVRIPSVESKLEGVYGAAHAAADKLPPGVKETTQKAIRDFAYQKKDIPAPVLQKLGIDSNSSVNTVPPVQGPVQGPAIPADLLKQSRSAASDETGYEE